MKNIKNTVGYFVRSSAYHSISTSVWYSVRYFVGTSFNNSVKPNLLLIEDSINEEY